MAGDQRTSKVERFTLKYSRPKGVLLCQRCQICMPIPPGQTEFDLEVPKCTGGGHAFVVRLDLEQNIQTREPELHAEPPWTNADLVKMAESLERQTREIVMSTPASEPCPDAHHLHRAAAFLRLAFADLQMVRARRG